jgi:hypothetical protein
MVVVAAVVVTPWTMRNAAEMHAFIPVGLQTGLQVAGTYNDLSRNDPEYTALWIPVSVVPRDAELFTQRGLTEVDIDRTLTRNGLGFIRQHPTYVGVVVFHNTLRMLHIADDKNEHYGILQMNFTPAMGVAARMGFYAAALLAIAGIFTRAVRHTPAWFWLTPMVFFILAAALAGTLRYRFPIDPFLLLAGAPVLAAGFSRVRGRTANQAARG